MDIMDVFHKMKTKYVYNLLVENELRQEKTCYSICKQQRHRSVHPHSLISTFVVGCLDSTISAVAICEVSRLLLTSVAEQVGLSLTRSQASEDRFFS